MKIIIKSLDTIFSICNLNKQKYSLECTHDILNNASCVIGTYVGQLCNNIDI